MRISDGGSGPRRELDDRYVEVEDEDALRPTAVADEEEEEEEVALLGPMPVGDLREGDNEPEGEEVLVSKVPLLLLSLP